MRIGEHSLFQTFLRRLDGSRELCRVEKNSVRFNVELHTVLELNCTSMNVILTDVLIALIAAAIFNGLSSALLIASVTALDMPLSIASFPMSASQ